jgi:hypothetical protein
VVMGGSIMRYRRALVPIAKEAPSDLIGIPLQVTVGGAAARGTR